MMTFNTASDVQKELEKVEYECTDLERRYDEIEQAIADNWKDDTSDLQTEHAGINARLQAATRVKDNLHGQWVDLYTSEQLEIFTEKSEEARHKQEQAKKLHDQADDLKRQAQELEKQARLLSTQSGDWQRAAQHWLQDRMAEGIEDLSGFIEVQDRLGLALRVESLLRQTEIKHHE